MLTGPGRVIRVGADGTRTVVLDGLNRPTSVAVGPDGALYVTNNGLSAGSGEVLRVEPWVRMQSAEVDDRTSAAGGKQ